MRRQKSRRVVALVILGVLALVAGSAAAKWYSDRKTPVALDLRTVNWRDADISGSLCHTKGLIRLRGGIALDVPSRLGYTQRGPSQDVSVFAGKIVYGDLTGDGNDEAALPVLCASHSAADAGTALMGVMIFDGARHRIDLVGVLLSQHRRLGEPSNIPEVRQMAPGKVTAVERFYEIGDANCCPSGRAWDMWNYASGRLTLT